MTVYIFPGQGSQIRGMGKSLFEEFPEIVKIADNILGYSISDLCLEDSNNYLDKTNYTQPALFVVNALSYMKRKLSFKEPEYLLGHSLGEYNALLAANVFDFETGLRLVQKRGELMSRIEEGSMAAVVGLRSSDVVSVLQQYQLNNIYIANYNSYTQVVLSGAKNDITRSKSLFENKENALFILLKVSGAFHSPYMNEVAKEFEAFLQNFNFESPSIPVISNLNAKHYIPSEIKLNLTKQITNPVYWLQSIEYLLDKNEKEFIELGPGSVLTGLIKRITQGN